MESVEPLTAIALAQRPTGACSPRTGARRQPDSRRTTGRKRLWVSGVSSWRHLAERGHWVEGCADHLGFAAVVPTPGGPKFCDLPPLADWCALTRAARRPAGTTAVSARSRPATAFATCRRAGAGTATDFFWGSRDHFMSLRRSYPLMHAMPAAVARRRKPCGPAASSRWFSPAAARGSHGWPEPAPHAAEPADSRTDARGARASGAVDPAAVRRRPLRGREPVAGLDDVYRDTPDSLLRQVESDLATGIGKFLLFGVPGEKDEQDFDHSFTAGQIAAIKQRFGDDLWLAVDVCLCSHTTHGHCGMLNDSGGLRPQRCHGRGTGPRGSAVRRGRRRLRGTQRHDGRPGRGNSRHPRMMRNSNAWPS